MLKIGDFSKLSQVSIKALRYYDEIGLLKPAHIDTFTNYRYYSVEQLPRLNRILALKDLGLALDQITTLVTDDLPATAIEDMLREQQSRLERTLKEEAARLARVQARLRQIAQEGQLPTYEVVVKPVKALRIAAARGTVPCYGQSDRLMDALVSHLVRQGQNLATCYPFMMIYHDEGYREQDPDVTVAAPVNRDLPSSESVQVYELPDTNSMVSVVHRGPYEAFSEAYEALMHFITTNGYEITGPNRQLFLHGPGHTEDPATFVTEIQFPVEHGPDA